MTSVYMMSVMWENFTGVRSDGAAGIWRLFIFVILLSGTIYAAYCRMVPHSAVTRPCMSMNDGFAAREEARLKELVFRFHDIYARRTESLETAINITNTNKLAFVRPHKDQPIASAGLPEIQYAEVMLPPPEISVRGVMSIGGKSAAVVNIPGEDAERIVKAGDSFFCMGSSVSVTRVSGNGLSFLWNGKHWDIPLR